ncbi:Bcl2/Adenovirus E1B 19 Kda Protein-Interacting Protein 3-Like [Manis pentadactyla]|nr:Bcl2/Adenovirus E1B 19 Kda Protein-Interacting Protein 3-Like [Manis pentadactyla]
MVVITEDVLKRKTIWESDTACLKEVIPDGEVHRGHVTEALQCRLTEAGFFLQVNVLQMKMLKAPESYVAWLIIPTGRVKEGFAPGPP